MIHAVSSSIIFVASHFKQDPLKVDIPSNWHCLQCNSFFLFRAFHNQVLKFEKNESYRSARCKWATTWNGAVVTLVGWYTDWATIITWCWLSAWGWWWWWNVCITGWGWAWTWWWSWNTNLTTDFWVSVTFLWKNWKKQLVKNNLE